MRVAFVALLTVATTALAAWADDHVSRQSLIGTWTSVDEEAGSFKWMENGQFVWTDGTTVNSGTWYYDTENDVVSMVLDPLMGADDQARVAFSDDGKTLSLSFFVIGRAVQETEWSANYEQE